jgi:hypothetical protein
MVVQMEPLITPYEYVGETDALGSLELTKLAKSFEQLEVGSLADYFPDVNTIERTVNIEQVVEGLGIMPIVRFGVPGGGYVEQDRIQSMTVQPAAIREEDFIEMALINQIREVGTYNTAANPLQKINSRMQKLMNRRMRTIDLMRAKVLLGGISYTDPRTKVSIDVSTNIPAHNFFKYDGWGGAAAAVTAGSPINGTAYAAAKNLNGGPNGRTEALLFTSSDGLAGVPWTHPRADLVRCLRLIKQFLYKTNKNKFVDIVMSSDLKAVIESTNEYVKASLGIPGIFINNGNAAAAETNSMSPTSHFRFGPDGEILTLAGMNVRVLDGLYRDPVTNKVTTYWPSHKVALVAPYSHMDQSARLGQTDHPVGEAENGQPGVYVRTSDCQAPAPPGKVIQLGDALLPYAIYPHWIAVLDVCEPEELTSQLILQSNLGYGTF